MWKVVIFLGKMNGRFFCSKTLDERRKYFHIREENALKGGWVRLMWWSQNDLFWICIDSHFWHKLTLPPLKCSKKTSELRFLSLLEKMLALFWHSGRGNYYLEKRPMSEFFDTSTQSKFGERQRQKGENGKRNYLHSSRTFLQYLSFRKYRDILNPRMVYKVNFAFVMLGSIWSRSVWWFVTSILDFDRTWLDVLEVILES